MSHTKPRWLIQMIHCLEELPVCINEYMLSFNELKKDNKARIQVQRRETLKDFTNCSLRLQSDHFSGWFSHSFKCQRNPPLYSGSCLWFNSLWNTICFFSLSLSGLWCTWNWIWHSRFSFILFYKTHRWYLTNRVQRASLFY